MKYLSVCSGIEAATVAWYHLGWVPIGFAETEAFPSAVLKHHYPEVPNLLDMTKYEKWNIERPDILVGGTPCQSFSVAGLRKGLHDPRGGLMLTFLEIAQRYRPKWIVWENVPGVLSSNGGKDFGSFLGALEELGYGWAYRILDAQWFGVAQRRKRVFVVGCFGDKESAAAVLFESESVRRDNPPSREEGKGFTHDIAPSLTSSGRGVERAGDTRGQDPVIACMAHGQGGAEILSDKCPTLNCNHEQPIVVHGTQDPITSDKAFPFGRNSGQENAVVYEIHQSGDVLTGDISASVGTNQNATGRNTPKVLTGMQVRRLTPVECERLQGFPDNYTNVPWRGKPESPDGPRYKGLGNSMAVPVMRWIGQRIDKVIKNKI